MRSKDGRRDLSLIRSSGSTARVLNLALVYERFGQTEEYSAKPMFKNPRLNRALILKHEERDLDFADAAIVWFADNTDCRSILTVDIRDFSALRLAKGRRFDLVKWF